MAPGFTRPGQAGRPHRCIVGPSTGRCHCYRVNYTASSFAEIPQSVMARYWYDRVVTHDGLGKSRVVKGQTQEELEAKASELMMTWETLWTRRQEAIAKEGKIALAANLTEEAAEAISALASILQATFESRYPNVWESMKDRAPFPKPRPTPPVKPNLIEPTYPEKPDPELIPRKPSPDDLVFQPRADWLDYIMPARKHRKIEKARLRYKAEFEYWKTLARSFNEKLERYKVQVRLIREATNEQNSQIIESYNKLLIAHNRDTASWGQQKRALETDQQRQHQFVEATKAAYLKLEPSAVREYVSAILNRSRYPEFCPKSFEMEYIGDTKTLVLDYYLPKVEDIPSVKLVKYVQSQDRFVETPISESARNKHYDEAIYQIALRTLHELFGTDSACALDSIVFNGIVETIDKSTGRRISPTILSIQVTKSEFQPIDLRHVDPRACFKKLKGVSAARLHTITPIAPVARISREDQRFVESHDVAAGLDDSVNLAAMDWEEFEHLIRELFAKEYSSNGGEVKVTQASRDGGVDAVAFDPDPIRGGKIVIQAKRYTNVVGVSAVRDLYGTVHNEGANKGILVTTAYFGSDAYEFANGKPITLLDGGNLLSLLAKHGHRAKIDLQAAKKEMGNKPSAS